MLICDNEIRQRLLQEDDEADLEKAIKLCSIIEESKSQAMNMDQHAFTASNPVDRVFETRRTGRFRNRRSRTPEERNTSINRSNRVEGKTG